MVKLIHSWQCNEEESLSDHRYISYCIEKHRAISTEYDYNGAKYITSEEGFKHFENHFITGIERNLDNTISDILTLETDIENTAGKFHNSIVTASRKSFNL